MSRTAVAGAAITLDDPARAPPTSLSDVENATLAFALLRALRTLIRPSSRRRWLSLWGIAGLVSRLNKRVDVMSALVVCLLACCTSPLGAGFTGASFDELQGPILTTPYRAIEPVSGSARLIGIVEEVDEEDSERQDSTSFLLHVERLSGLSAARWCTAAIWADPSGCGSLTGSTRMRC